MNSTRWLLLVFALLLLAIALDFSYFYPQLPDRVAGHFNAQGEPDAWTTKARFLQTTILTLALLALTFPGIYLLFPLLPSSVINVPHKEFWLAPERASYFWGLLGNFILAFGVLTVGLFGVVIHLILRSNLTPQPHLGAWVWVAIAVYVVLDLALVTRLIWSFYHPERFV